MNEIENQKTLSDLKGSQFLLGILLITSLFIGFFYFDLGKTHEEDEELVTLSVKTSDTPEHVPYSKRQRIHYALKAQEFNCWFWIADEAYQLVVHDHVRKRLLEEMKRGDDMQIIIYKSEEQNINNMYFKGMLAGLSVKDEVVFTPEEVRFLNEANRQSNLRTSIIVWLITLAIFVIGKLIKASDRIA